MTLAHCNELFLTTEKLGPEDPWYCNRCKEFKQATKKFDLWKLPPVLVVHLKRFSYKNRYWREKLETYVDYPVEGLDLSSYVKGPHEGSYVYDLYAVSVSVFFLGLIFQPSSKSLLQNHYGSLGGGHYTAYAKNKNDGKWYKFDDSSVSKVDDGKVQTSSAYMLFYQRRDTMTPSPSASTSASVPNGSGTNSNGTNNTENHSKEEEGQSTQEMNISNGDPME